MKRYFFLFTVLLGTKYAISQTRLPSVPLNTLKGETVNSKTFIDDNIPVVISFWSTTCKPCIDELNAFTEQWKKWQNETKFKIIAVSTDDARSAARVRSFASGFKWPFTVLLDKNQDFKRSLNVNSIPQLYIVSPKGDIVYSRIGYTPGSEEKVFKVLKEL